MSATENNRILQAAFDELAKGNARPFVDAMSDDFSWTITGAGTVGRYVARQEDRSRRIVRAPFRAIRDAVHKYRAANDRRGRHGGRRMPRTCHVKASPR